jgi:hypothetical protein
MAAYNRYDRNTRTVGLPSGSGHGSLLLEHEASDVVMDELQRKFKVLSTW